MLRYAQLKCICKNMNCVGETQTLQLRLSLGVPSPRQLLHLGNKTLLEAYVKRYIDSPHVTHTVISGDLKFKLNTDRGTNIFVADINSNK